MKQHCKEKEGWVKARGQTWQAATVQTFFQGPYRRYFEVASPASSQARAQRSDISVLIDALIQEGERKDKQDVQREAVVDSEQLPADNTPWMRKTRWSKKFAGKDLRAIASLGEKPTKEEPSLQVLWASMSRVFQCCKDSVAAWREHEEDGDLVLGWLNSPKQGDFNPEPFSVYYETSTHDKYTAYFKRFLCYCLRFVHREEGHGYTFSNEERHSLEEIWGLLEFDLENPAVLDLRVFKLSVDFWMHQSRAHSKSAIVHFCAVLGIDGKRGCYRPPNDYGQVLAGLLYCSRLLLFEHALPMDKRHDIPNPYKTFLRVHHQWLVDGRPTPFHYIDNLLAYALGAGKDVGGRPRVQWSSDKQTLIYLGEQLRLSQLRQFYHDLCDATTALLCKELMFLPDDTAVRSIDLTRIVDDMNDSTVGYSFVCDGRNDLGNGRIRMLNRLWSSLAWPQLLSVTPERLELDPKGWQKYVHKHSRFKELLFLLAHIGGGGPARGTEILPIRHVNATQGMRNTFALDGQIMFVTAKDKSEAMTGRQKVIPRFLPSRVGQLLVAYLSDVLPFIMLVDRDSVCARSRSFLWADAKGIWDTPRGVRP